MFSIIATLALSTAQAQSFILPIKGDIMGRPDAYVVTADGRRLEGQLGMHAMVNGSISSAQILVDGEGEKYRASEMQEMGIKSSGVAAALAVVSGAASGQSSSSDFDEVLDRDYAYFESAQMPGLIPRSAMLQVLNPGFNSRISVFVDPDATSERGFIMGKIFGNADSSYLVSKDGSRALKVKKRGYGRAFRALFSDCAAMEGQGRVRYWDIAAHVYTYEQSCGTDAP
jgi:hypothetical protein